MSQTKLKIVIGLIIILSVIAAVFIQKHWSQPSEGGIKRERLRAGKVKGPDNAPVTIDEYSDFQCPSCASSQQPLEELVQQFKDVVKVQFHHFPLEMHRFAMKAALAAECAHEANQFWDYQTLIFKNQAVWSRDPDPESLFLAMGNHLKLSPQEFLSCQKKPEIEQRVLADRQSGESLKVQSTPTFFINGERLVGSKQLKENAPGTIKKILQGTLKDGS